MMNMHRHQIDSEQINNWIVGLQGTGRFELNAIVNDLLMLRQLSSMKVFDTQTVSATLRQLKVRVQRLLQTPTGLMPSQIETLQDVQLHINAISEG